MTKYVNIAIDGPAGSGKSTVAEIVAKRTGYIHLDTGAMYRTIGYIALEHGVDLNDKYAIECLADDAKIAITFDNDKKQHMISNGVDITDKIRTNEVSNAASAVAVVPAVRLKLVALQRNIARANNVVLEGRDIGSYVLPDSDVKVFLTATPEERARRRLNELHAKGKELDMTLEKMIEDINERDYRDTHREFAPLTIADDAIVIDSTSLSIEEVCDKIIILTNEVK